MKQLSFKNLKAKREFKGRPCDRKAKRPFSSKHALHIVLKAQPPKGKSFLKYSNYFSVLEIIERQSRRFKIKIPKQSINSNHIHLLLQTKSKTALSGFLRAVSGLISRKILSVERGKTAGLKLWLHRPYSRIITWGREFARVVKYIKINIEEGIGTKESRRYSSA